MFFTIKKLTRGLLSGLFIPVVANPQQNIHRDHNGIDDIKDKSKVVVLRHDLAADTADISQKDKAAEENALAARRPAFIHARDGQRPGNAKAKDHSGFQ